MDFSNIDAIIFDNDGVLVDSEVIHIDAERELLAELGLEYNLQTYIGRFVGLSNADFHSELSRDYEVRFSRTFPDDFSARLKARVWPRIEAELRPIPGVVELVHKFGGPVAVASSAVLPRLNRKLQLTNLFELFAPHVYSSDHVVRGKPEPDLFVHAAKMLGVLPSRCMVIEDSVNGVIAGVRADMLTVGFLGGSHLDAGHRDRLREAGANMIAENHDEISSYFAL